MTAANVSPISKDRSDEMERGKPKKKPSVKAREAEAEDGYVTVEQCGVELKIPIAGKTPLAAFIAFTKGDDIGGTELMLGPEQWAAFMEKNPTVDDFNAIGDQLQALSGN